MCSANQLERLPSSVGLNFLGAFLLVWVGKHSFWYREATRRLPTLVSEKLVGLTGHPPHPTKWSYQFAVCNCTDLTVTNETRSATVFHSPTAMDSTESTIMPNRFVTVSHGLNIVPTTIPMMP